MQLEDMRIYIATVETRSFTAAANKLSLSKQYVSKRVMSLEASLGVGLLMRNTRKLAITDLGLEFYERAKRIIGDVEDAEQAMCQQHSALRGRLKISAPMSFGMLHLSTLIAQFLLQHEAVRIDLELSDRRVDIVGEGFDMAIRIGHLADSTLIAQKLATIKVVAICSEDYLRRRGRPLVPADLIQHACLLYGQEQVSRWRFRIDGKPESLELQGPFRSNNGESIRDAAVAGLGIAFLPEFIVADALAAGQLVTILDDYLANDFTAYAVYPQHRERSRPIREFNAFLREQIAQRFA